MSVYDVKMSSLSSARRVAEVLLKPWYAHVYVDVSQRLITSS